MDNFYKYLDNEFVDHYDDKNDKIIYTKDFYVVLYKKLQDGLNPIEAYEALGFNTTDLGKNRAYQAANKAKKLANKPNYTIDPSNYDGSVPLEQMGNLTMEEENAYLKARAIYLESMNEILKKKPAIMQEILTSLKKK